MSDYSTEHKENLLGETLGCAVLDSGCTSTVCGKTWLATYLETLSVNDSRLVSETFSSKSFRFGDGETYPSLHTKTIPIYTGNQRSFLDVEVIDCEIPLLLSNSSLKRAHAHLDFGSDEINFLGENIPMKISKSGHYYIQLSREPVYNLPSTQRIMFTTPINSENVEESRKFISKLHRQFAHPHSSRLKKLILDSGVTDKNIMDLVDDISDKCDICKRYKKPLPRPIVAFPAATSFCEVVAMDLKDILGFSVLHMIDHATRYSSACVIPNKQKETIVKAVLQHWVRLFGSPKYFLFDNGGEFVNSEMLEFAEQFNITLRTTAAESAWSNGMCERHNEILADLVRKVHRDNDCAFNVALCWALAAKNSLTNVYGFSPNQLVFGKNIELPAAHHDKLPTQNVPSSHFIMKNLNALHTARQAFVQQESSEKLRRALNRKTRGYSDISFQQGDTVYYHRNNSTAWHGPAKVLGKDGQQYLLKHGGMYIRVHPCRVQLRCSMRADYNLDQDPCTQPRDAPTHREPTAQSSNNSAHLEPTIQSNGVSVHYEPYNQISSDSFESVITSSSAHLNDSNSRDDELETDNYVDVSESRDDELETEINSQIQINPDFPEETLPLALPENDPEHPGDELSFASDHDNINRKSKLAARRLLPYNKPGNSEEPFFMTNIAVKEAEDILFGTQTESARFDSAKTEEIQKWKDLNTFKEVDDEGQPTISCRWVCTEKLKGDTLTLKARLVVRGFEEDTSQLQTDSPTCSKESIRLLLSLLSAHHWSMHSLDIKSAFLQGNDVQRDIFVKPPKFANTNKLWKMKKTPYGLSDAGRQWYARVKKELCQLGAVQSSYDKATFIWYRDGFTIGIMIVHVDDFLYGGSSEFHESVIQRIRVIFLVGLEESESFRYLGLCISEHPNGILMSTKGYGLSCKEIPTSTLGQDRSRKLSPTEITSLKQLSGQLNWVTTQSRPDMAFENCMIGNSTSKATVRDIYSANRALRRLRDNEQNLFFPRLSLDSLCLVGFCDASFANLPDNGSQGAFIIFLVDGKGLYCPIAWQSRRIRRVVNSTIAAECLSAVEAAETCAYLSKNISELLCKGSKTVPIYILSDNKSLVDHLHSTTSVENKRLRIDICVLRDMFQNGDISQFKWIPTNLQVANALTKKGSSSVYLNQILQNSLKFDMSSGAFIPRD